MSTQSFRRFIARLLPLAFAAVPLNAATPYPLGVYTGNPNGSDAAAMTDFKAGFDAHNAVLGARPKFFNIFTDFQRDPSTWVSNAGWSAWSSAQSGTAYVGPASGIVPVVGIPLAWSGLGWSNVDYFYLYTIDGQYDAIYNGIVDAWADNGYKIVDFRIAYEFNGSFMMWAPGNSAAPSANADFIAAFRRVADVIHARARQRGIRAMIHWNPAAINYTSYDVETLYPGDAYVDVIAIDQYSPMWPIGLTDWSTGGTVEMTDRDAWAAIPANRAHYWRYPNATHYAQTPTTGSKGWSMGQAIAFAKLHRKPLAVDETGVGSQNGALGPADDPEFPKVLAKMLREARSKGVVIRNVNIWDATLSDGDWDFRGGSKPQAAAAWKSWFGDVPARVVAPKP